MSRFFRVIRNSRKIYFGISAVIGLSLGTKYYGKSFHLPALSKKYFNTLFHSIDIFPVTVFALTDDNEKNETAMNYAIENNDLKMLEDLIANGANVNEKDHNGCAPLITAIKHGNFETFKFLIHKGASVDSIEHHNTHALHVAVLYERMEIVKYLIKHKCNINAEDDNCNTALFNAICKQNIEIVRYLLDNGAEINVLPHYESSLPFFLSIRTGNVPIIKLLIEYGADINKRNINEGNTSLHEAVRSNNIELVKLLIENGADPNIGNFRKCTPLDIALYNNYTPVVEYIRASVSYQSSLITRT